MDLSTLTENGIRNVKKEHELMSKMLECAEKGQKSKFEIFTERFKQLRDQTDSIATYILDNFGLHSLEQYLSNMAFIRTEQDKVHCQTFLDIAITLGVINTTTPGVMGTDCMSEEYSKELFDIYLWGVDNENMTPGEKKCLHDFMLMPFSSSRYIRSYFSGEYNAAEKLSDPDRLLGTNANGVALNTYYIDLNNIVKATNRTEMYESYSQSDSFQARRRYYKYQLMAINNLMAKRGLAYKVTEEEPSDFTREVLVEASSSVDEYKKTLKERSVGTVIWL